MLFLVALPGDHGRNRAARALLGAARRAVASRAIRMIALTTLPVGFCIGTVEVAVPAFSDAQGSPELAGDPPRPLVGGERARRPGLRPPRGRPGLVDTYVLIALLFPLACLPLAAASSPAAMALLVMLAGAPIAPLIASRNELVAAVARRGTGTESFTWLLTALVAGLSAGAAVAGAVIEAEGWPSRRAPGGTAVAALGAVARRSPPRSPATPSRRRTRIADRSIRT